MRFKLANDHEMGIRVAIFTRDWATPPALSLRRVQVGMVGINVPIPSSIAYYTFGGWKVPPPSSSTNTGHTVFRFYTKAKTVTSRGCPASNMRAPSSAP